MDQRVKYTEIFDYLSSPELPLQPESTIVFGRNDPLVARAAGDLIIANLVDTAVITGGIGKDSGNILELGYNSEAAYLYEALADDAIDREYTHKLDVVNTILEEEAGNGVENARKSIAILTKGSLPTNSITAVAHATSTLRLAETLAFETSKIQSDLVTIYRKPTNYSFDPYNPADQAEARAELNRLTDWPAKNRLGPQRADLPMDLVDFVKDIDKKAPIQPPQILFSAFRKMPRSIKVRVLRHLSK